MGVLRADSIEPIPAENVIAGKWVSPRNKKMTIQTQLQFAQTTGCKRLALKSEHSEPNPVTNQSV
jgi:hypothetical protein